MSLLNDKLLEEFFNMLEKIVDLDQNEFPKNVSIFKNI